VFVSVKTKGVGKMGYFPGLCVSDTCPCIGFASPIVVDCPIHLLFSETDNNDEGIEKTFGSFQIVKVVV
jgi:hypothetical protein